MILSESDSTSSALWAGDGGEKETLLAVYGNNNGDRKKGSILKWSLNDGEKPITLLYGSKTHIKGDVINLFFADWPVTTLTKSCSLCDPIRAVFLLGVRKGCGKSALYIPKQNCTSQLASLKL